MQPMKKSKFSVTPFQPESNTSIGTTSRESSMNDASLKKTALSRDNTVIKDNSIIRGLDRIQEDVFGGEAQSRSELQPLCHDQSEMVPRISMSSLQPSRYTERYSRSVNRAPATARQPYRTSAFTAVDDYYGCDKENGRRESGSSTSSNTVRNSVRPMPNYDITSSTPTYVPPATEDVYQLFRSMENKLDNLRNVIQMQKGRLNGGPIAYGDSIVESSMRASRHDSKMMRSSRSEYLRRL